MIGWTMECVTSTSFSLSINGSLYGYFKGKRGLHQGDPISPYLFTLIMEVLTLMLNRRARDYGTFIYHRYCSRLNLISLCFSDDLFLFTHGDADSARVIMDMLEEFKDALGLSPKGKLPVKYLVVPLVPSHLLYRDCKELMEKVKRRITDWKNKSLSLAGRGKAKVVWDVVCLPKWEGVLGDGSKDLAWFDNWCSVSPLVDSISNRDIYSVGFNHSSKVRDIIVNNAWAYPDSWMLKYNKLNLMGVPHLSNASDCLVWRDYDNVESGFSVATTWKCIRLRFNEVWNHMKRLMGYSNIPSNLDDIMGFISLIAKM
ncbi:hypothetical protein Tco_1480835, partial [Tanacetum coccineum]